MMKLKLLDGPLPVAGRQFKLMGHDGASLDLAPTLASTRGI
jgi:hypothetical protein